MQFRFQQWQLNEEPQLSDVRCSFTQTPTLRHLHATGLLWLLDALQLVAPIVCVYLKQRFLHPKCAVFSFIASTSEKPRRPCIGCPVALFCIDVIQAENFPLSRCKRSRPQADFGEPDWPTENEFQTKARSKTPTRTHARTSTKTQTKTQRAKSADKSADKSAADSISASNQNAQIDKLIDSKLNRPVKGCKLFKCLHYRLPSAYCRVKIFNQQFTCSPANGSTNPLWNFRSFIPIFSHNQHSIEQLKCYHSLFAESERNPIDLNASHYQQLDDDQGIKDEKKEEQKNLRPFISFELLQNLSVTIQLFDKQAYAGKRLAYNAGKPADQDKLIGEFSISDPSEYFLDSESNGQSIWLSSASAGVLAKDLDPSIKLNVRFTFLTLSQFLSSVLLSNAYLANRLAFPVGMLLLFIDSAIGLSFESVKSKLNPKIEYGFQIVCQLGNQTLYTSICTDRSFIWENEMLFCVHSPSLQKLVVSLVARSLNASDYDLTTLTTSRLDLSDLIEQPTVQRYCPLYLKQRAHLKLLLTFRAIHFPAKLIANCLRNAKVAEEDALVREKQSSVNEKLRPVGQFSATAVAAGPKTTAEEEEKPAKLISKLRMKAEPDEELDEIEHDSHEEIDQRDSVETKQQPEAINIAVNVRMRWPKAGKLVVEIVDLRCRKLLTLFQMYSINVYLVFVLREKEKALQSRRTKNFQLKSSTVAVNQELKFNCIRKPLSAYHLNVSLHEKRTEEYSKVAEVYSALPPLILASGPIDKQIVLDLTPMYLKTSGFNEAAAALSPEYELDQFEVTTTKQEK